MPEVQRSSEKEHFHISALKNRRSFLKNSARAALALVLFSQTGDTEGRVGKHLLITYENEKKEMATRAITVFFGTGIDQHAFSTTQFVDTSLFSTPEHRSSLNSIEIPTDATEVFIEKDDDSFWNAPQLWAKGALEDYSVRFGGIFASEDIQHYSLLRKDLLEKTAVSPRNNIVRSLARKTRSLFRSISF